MVVLPLIYSEPSQLFQLSRVPIFAMIGISIVILTGWAGQLSLGQMAFVGVGAMGTAALAGRGVPVGPASRLLDRRWRVASRHYRHPGAKAEGAACLPS